VFDDIAAAFEVFRDLNYERLGRWGVRLQGPPPARMLPYIYSDVHQ
jgi:hypothetical protein